MAVIDSYSETLYDGLYTFDDGSSSSRPYQTFTGNGYTLTDIDVYIAVSSTDPGTYDEDVWFEIYAHSGTFGSTGVPTGTVLATSQVRNSTTLSDELILENFTFSGANQITLEDGVNYCLVGKGGVRAGAFDSTYWGRDSSSPSHPGNAGFNDTPGTKYQAGTDLCFYINGTAPIAWYDPSWNYRTKVTVASAEVGATLTDFPVYVDLADLPAGFHTNVKTDGGDIRVTRSDGTTECAREVVTYDSVTDTGELHFKANSLSSTVDTDFYIYYGNSGASEPAASATYGAENVWDSNYKAVYHLNDLTTSTVKDSTASGKNGTKLAANEPIQTTGQLGYAQEFDGTNDEIDLGSIVSSDPLMINGSDITISFWARIDDTGDTYQRIVDKSTAGSYAGGYGVHVDPGTNLVELWADGGVWITSNSQTFGGFKYYACTGVSGAATGEIYVNGAADTASRTARTIQNTTANMKIGTWNHSTAREFNGALCELRISNTIRSADWIAAEYSNQSVTTTFYTAGSEEAQPSTSASINDIISISNITSITI